METIEEAVKKCERSTEKCKSFFVKRLEQHLAEKGISIPDRIFVLLDTPFEDFTPEYAAMYEKKIKGQALFHIFSDMLVEIYQGLEADRIGWEASVNFLQDTPMKMCATHALNRIDQLEAIPDDDYMYVVEQLSGSPASQVTPRERKYGVKPYASGGKNRWWKREGGRMAGSGKN
jgi:hypothetical protein